MAALPKQICKSSAVAVMPSADLRRWADLCCPVIIFKPALDLCALLLELAPDVALTHSPAPVVCCGSGEVHACSVVQPHDVLHAQAVTVINLCLLHAVMTTGDAPHFLKGSKLVKTHNIVFCILVSLSLTELLTRVSNLILCKILIYCLCCVRMRGSVHSSQVCSTSQPCAEALYNVCATDVHHILTNYMLDTTMFKGYQCSFQSLPSNSCTQTHALKVVI